MNHFCRDYIHNKKMALISSNLKMTELINDLQSRKYQISVHPDICLAINVDQRKWGKTRISALLSPDAHSNKPKSHIINNGNRTDSLCNHEWLQNLSVTPMTTGRRRTIRSPIYHVIISIKISEDYCQGCDWVWKVQLNFFSCSANCLITCKCLITDLLGRVGWGVIDQSDSRL